MPILLDDVSMFTPVTTAQTPKFFDKDVLTGNGKSSGLINQNVRPGRYELGEGPHTLSTDILNTKTRNSGSAIVTHAIPVAVLTKYSVEDNADRDLIFAMPVLEDLHHVTGHATKLSYDAYVGLTPQGFLVTKDGSGDKMMTSLRTLYRMEVYVVDVGTAPETVLLKNHAPHTTGPGFVMMGWSYAPLDDIEDLIRDATMRVSGKPGGAYVDVDALSEWMSDYDVYDRVCRLAEEWAGIEIADVIGDHIRGLFASGNVDNAALNRLVAQLRFLETYPVALEAYKSIHATVMATCPADIAGTLVKQNINLLMNHTLQELNDLKPQLPTPPMVNGQHSVNPRYSSQQTKAITADEPLVLVQSGAGTGKSSTILARIDHMVKDRGVDPTDITVISFTNAAAENIRARNPQVGSMTIASMIHSIYSLNFPQHELSGVDTIINSLDIFYPTNPLARTFARRLMEIESRRRVPGATTALNAFVEHYRDEIIEMLDTIKQTCLELEIILAYQMIDTMKEPAHVSSKYLIVDEVQDNSIFEFIYVLKYVAKHKENLFIVGDASQTLYEFRASNPKALNALEASDVFACYQLTTNYRSNQAILDMANVHLGMIEANRIARIQLRANAIKPPTAAEFVDRVTLDYRDYTHVANFNDDLPAYMQNVIKPWVDARLANDEQVAFLAYSRSHTFAMQAALTKLYPNIEVVSLVSEKMYSTTVFSEFVKKHWDEVKQVPNLANASFAITQGIQNHLPTLVRGGADPKKVGTVVMRMTQEWWTENHHAINTWVNLAGQTNVSTGAPLLSSDEFFDNLRGSLLQFEISRNAARQAVLNQRNKERKKANMAVKPKLVVSTVHGAKGLEFDNVVGLYKYDNSLSEETKRLYYVMLTRAISREFILAWGTIKKPKIEADYQLIVNELTRKQQIEALRAQGHNPDILSEDEVEAALAHLQQMATQAIEDGDLELASSLVPVAPEISIRGVALPKDDDEDQDDDAEDDSAFTKATA